jgi:hypothetical protein
LVFGEYKVREDYHFLQHHLQVYSSLPLTTFVHIWKNNKKIKKLKTESLHGSSSFSVFYLEYRNPHY